MVYTFIGKSHFPDDPRLYHRIARELNNRQIEIHWLDFHNRPPVDNEIYYHHTKNLIDSFNQLRTIPSDVVQISDPREWLFGVFTRLFTKAKLVYDSHEDYYGQHTIKWQQTNNPAYFFSRYVLWFLNLLCAFISHVTWSTDEYGTKHLKSVQPNTCFLPNYVRKDAIVDSKSSFGQTDLKALNFLYVGSYNSERGLSEFLDHLINYNRSCSTTHTLTIFGFSEKFPDTFTKSECCTFKDYTPMDQLYSEMVNYDVGICLWLENLKHKRNIPIKIMEYMAIGLPVLVSNFGYMKTYSVDSKAGIGIDPLSYHEFEQALSKLENRNVLETYSQNGLSFTEQHLFEPYFQKAFNAIGLPTP